MQNILIEKTQHKFDTAIAITGAMIPVGIAIGSVAFEATVVLTSLIWIVRVIKFKDCDLKRLIEHPVILPSFAVFISIIASAFINGGGSKGYLHDLSIVRNILCLAALIDTSFRFPVWKYLYYGIIVCLVYAIANIISVNLIGYDFVGHPLARFLYKQGVGNRYPTLLVYITTFFLSWGILDSNLKAKKRAMIIAAGLTGFASFCFFHVRTVLLAFIAGMFFSMCYAVFRKKSIKLAALFIFILALSVVIFMNTTAMLYFATLYQRFFIWKVTMKMWLDNPIFGVGITSFPDVFIEIIKAGNVQPYLAPNGYSYFVPDGTHAHNIILQILSCTGIVGLGCSIWLALNVIKIFLKDLSGHRLGFVSWPVVYFTISFATFNVYNSWDLALTVFIISALSCREKQISLSKE